ncbi:MAG: hypothetical protein ACT4P8_04280 [Betaproteobacteria bacterium]
MFDKDRFIEECRAVLREGNAHDAVREIVARAVSNPTDIIRAFGEPKRGNFEKVYEARDLTILHLCWGPRMEIMPHDHRMWAVIGIYGGREENVFYRRGDRGLVRHGTKTLEAKDTVALGANVIHAVTNPLDCITAAIHVYGGDFFGVPRSEWDPVTLEEQPYDVAHTIKAFEESNARIVS